MAPRCAGGSGAASRLSDGASSPPRGRPLCSPRQSVAVLWAFLCGGDIFDNRRGATTATTLRFICWDAVVDLLASKSPAFPDCEAGQNSSYPPHARKCSAQDWVSATPGTKRHGPNSVRSGPLYPGSKRAGTNPAQVPCPPRPGIHRGAGLLGGKSEVPGLAVGRLCILGTCQHPSPALGAAALSTTLSLRIQSVSFGDSIDRGPEPLTSACSRTAFGRANFARGYRLA